MITHFTILGERCSGTNFLENAITENFSITLTWDHGFKHFFGFSEYNNSDHILFIGIVRDPFTWLNSFYIKHQHLPKILTKSPKNFLNNEFWSYIDNKNLPTYGNEIVVDRNIYTKERYKNVFECRKIKLKFLIEDMPSKVKNYILIRYEDLRDNYLKTLELIREKGCLKKKENIIYPIKIPYYKKNKNKLFKKNSKPIFITREQILAHTNFDVVYEKQLGYIT